MTAPGFVVVIMGRGDHGVPMTTYENDVGE